MTTTPAMTTAQRTRSTRLNLAAGPDGRFEVVVQTSGRMQFWDFARALAAWAAEDGSDVRDLPERPGEQWALERIRTTLWKLGIDRITDWPTQVQDDARAAVAIWAYNAAWLLWGEPFDIPNAELDAALNTYTDPFYYDAWG